MLQQVREMFGARKFTADEAYRKLVFDTADGKPIPDNTVDICVAAGRSVAEFEGDVGKLSERRQAAADLKKAEGMAPEIERLNDAYTKASAERQAIEKKQRAEMEAASSKVNELLEARRTLVSRQSKMLSLATRTLHGSADPAIADQIAALQHRKESIRAEANTSIKAEPSTDAKVLQQRTEWLEDLQREETEIAQQIAELEAKRLDPEACVIG